MGLTLITDRSDVTGSRGSDANPGSSNSGSSRGEFEVVVKVLLTDGARRHAGYIADDNVGNKGKKRLDGKTSQKKK